MAPTYMNIGDGFYEGPRGGIFYINDNGNRQYVSDDSDDDSNNYNYNYNNVPKVCRGNTDASLLSDAAIIYIPLLLMCIPVFPRLALSVLMEITFLMGSLFLARVFPNFSMMVSKYDGNNMTLKAKMNRRSKFVDILFTMCRFVFYCFFVFGQWSSF